MGFSTHQWAMMSRGSAGSMAVSGEGGGAFTHGAAFTITGSGFGTKAYAAPLVWAPMDGTSDPSSLGRVSAWTGVQAMAFAAGEGYAGLGSMKATDSSGSWVAGVIAAFVVVLCLAFASVAHADDLLVSWTNPTHNTTGTAIPASGPGSLTGTRVEWGSCSGSAFGTKAGEVTAPAGATSATITGVAPAATYCVRAFARNTYGAESASSNVASKVVPVPVPNPPVLAVPVIAGMTTTPVYSVTKAGAMSTFVGFADVGTPCTGPALFAYRGKTFREVPRSAVKLWGSTTLRLAAPCSTG